ncbi:MAG: bifunctional serine/threonine-protein kinase/formylglycine-generating enzyme family protein [Planctomycetota bacterium]
MKRCPKCMREYDDSALFCKIDGEDLVLAIPVAPHSATDTRLLEAAPDNSDELPDITVLHYGGAFDPDPTSTAALEPNDDTKASATVTRRGQGTSRSSQDVEDPFEGKLLEGRYRILERLSVGGMGMVYRAIDLNLSDLEVAIKFIRPEIATRPRFRQIFQQAELLIAKIQHTNVVRVYNFNETSEGYLYLVMDFVPGKSLRHHIYRRVEEGHTQRGRRRQIREDTELLRQLASGLQAMHRAGIVHRDLKPDNVILQPQPGGGVTPRIIDFGIATQVDPETGQTPLDDASRIMSTNYAPPEQILHEPMDRRSDIFSFGLIGYELLARQNPLKIRTTERSRTRRTPRVTTQSRRSDRGATSPPPGTRGSTGSSSSPSVDEAMLDNLDRIDRIPPLRRLSPEVPRSLERILLRCLEYDPGLRYPSAAEVERDLSRFLAQRRRLTALLSIAAVLLLLAGGALGIALSGRQKLLETGLEPGDAAPFDLRAGDVGILHVGQEVTGDLRLALAPNFDIVQGEVFLERNGERMAGDLRLQDLEARLPRRLLEELPDGEYSLHIRLLGPGGRPSTTSPRSLRLHKDTVPPSFGLGLEAMKTDELHWWYEGDGRRETLFVGQPSFHLHGELMDSNLHRLMLRDIDRNRVVGEREFTPSDAGGVEFSLSIENALPGRYELVAEDWAGNTHRLELGLAIQSGALPIELRLTSEGLPEQGLPVDWLSEYSEIPVRGDQLTLFGGAVTGTQVPLSRVTATLGGELYPAPESVLRELVSERGGPRRLLQIPLDGLRGTSDMRELRIFARDELGRELSKTLRIRHTNGPSLTLAGVDVEGDGPTVVGRLARLPDRLELRAEGLVARPDQLTCRITIGREGISREISAWEADPEGSAFEIRFSTGTLEVGTWRLQVEIVDALQQRIELFGGRPFYLVLDDRPPKVDLGAAFAPAPDEFVEIYQSQDEARGRDVDREIWLLDAQALDRELTAYGFDFHDEDLARGRVTDIDRQYTWTFGLERDEKGHLNLPPTISSAFRQSSTTGRIQFLEYDWVEELRKKERSETRLDIELEDGRSQKTLRRLLVIVDAEPPELKVISPDVKQDGETGEDWIVADPRLQFAQNAPFPVRFRVTDSGSGVATLRFGDRSAREVTGNVVVFDEPVAESHLLATASDWAGNRTSLRLRVPRPPSATVQWLLPSGVPVPFRLVPRGPFTMGNNLRLSDTDSRRSPTPFEALGTETIPSRPEKEVVLERDLYLSENEITNAQYRTFIQSGGYENDEYWKLSWTVETADGPMEVHAALLAPLDDLELGSLSLPEPALLWTSLPNRRLLFTDAKGKLGPRRWSRGQWPAEEKGEHPVTGVSFVEAMAFCRWLGSLHGIPDRVRLPNEREWEAAARRNAEGSARRYVWGERWDPTRCHYARPRKELVGTFAHEHQDVSATGLYNLAGNVTEWAIPYPAHYSPSERKAWYRGVYRGGSFDDLASLEPSEAVQIYFTTFVHREANLLFDRVRTRGFRCLVLEADLPRELRN